MERTNTRRKTLDTRHMKEQVGMNSEYADENYKLLLNIIHWLDGKVYLEEREEGSGLIAQGSEYIHATRNPEPPFAIYFPIRMNGDQYNG